MIRHHAYHDHPGRPPHRPAEAGTGMSSPVCVATSRDRWWRMPMSRPWPSSMAASSSPPTATSRAFQACDGAILSLPRSGADAPNSPPPTLVFSDTPDEADAHGAGACARPALWPPLDLGWMSRLCFRRDYSGIDSSHVENVVEESGEALRLAQDWIALQHYLDALAWTASSPTIPIKCPANNAGRGPPTGDAPARRGGKRRDRRHRR